MWVKAIIVDKITYIKRDLGFWFSILLVFGGGILIGASI